MKRINKRKQHLLKKRQIAKYKKQLRLANKLKNEKYNNRRYKKHKKTKHEITRKNAYINYIYNRKTKPSRKAEIVIKNSLGIELEEDIPYFLEKARELLSANAKEIVINMAFAQRIWPSAINLLCSFSHYVVLTSLKRRKPPKVFSIHPNNEVGIYLNECGFNSYVGIKDKKFFTKSDYTVNIKREHDNKNIYERGSEVLTLVKKFSGLTPDEIEEFDCIILSEIFNNVTEHGITKYDRGWWVLAQYHPNHKFISICISDNGIGIKKTLVFGPQREIILEHLSEEAVNDGEFIKTAAEIMNISGADDAAVAKDISFLFIPLGSKYPRGSRRGRGLKRILLSCRRLGITLTIISRSGFYQRLPDENKSPRVISYEQDVYAGTLYHLLIPIKHGVIENA